MLYNILNFVAGLGVFLFAVKILGGALERLSSIKIKKGLSKIGKNSFRGIGFGTLMAFITQSSLASVVMTMSFADSSMLTLLSSITIIFGCNIGTSLSTILISFNTLSISKFLAILTLIGALIATFSKNKKTKDIGTIIASFGMFFVGLNILSGACSELKLVFIDIFTKINNPFLYLILGLVITLITQSSTVTIALLISIVGGTSGFDVISIVNCAFAIYGSNIGTALTAMLVSVSSGVESKKVAFSHVIFNLVGSVIFIVLTYVGYLKLFNLFVIDASFVIVLINMIFNIVTTIIILPFKKPLAKLCNACIHQKVKKEDEIYYLKANNSPIVAINQMNTCIIDLIERLEKVSYEVQDYCVDYNIAHSKQIRKKLEKLLQLNEKIISNIISIQSEISGEEENIYFLQVTTKNVERIIKNHFRILNYVKNNKDNKIYFTQKQISVFKELNENLKTITTNLKLIVELINKGESKKEYFVPNLKILEVSEIINEIVNKLKREMIATNIYTEKKIEKCDMFINIVNCIENTSANYTDIALMVTNFLTKNKEND